ncbi:MAG: hypothetical protein SGJ00_10840 [bacterium]|nr:hypothetical protein [bacterium]
MKKGILLIEDRVTRQEIYLSKFKIDLDSFDCLDNIKGGKRFIEIKKDLSNANKLALEPYRSILAHRSALNQIEREFLYNYCKAEKKPLAFFSGGISSISYSDNEQFQFLSINANDFYSNKLPFFLNEAGSGNLKLVHLAFGQQWTLNLLLAFTNKLNSIRYEKEIETERIPTQILKSKLGLENSSLLELLNYWDALPNWLNDIMVINPIEKIELLQRKINDVLLKVTLSL